MSGDRSDEIRIIVLKQRIDEFMKYLDEKKEYYFLWGIMYSNIIIGEILSKAKKVFSGTEDKPVNLPN